MKNLTEINLEKSRSGVYKDNEENRRLHRVGQRYGEPKKEEISSESRKSDLEELKQDMLQAEKELKAHNKRRSLYASYTKGEENWSRTKAKLEQKLDTLQQEYKRRFAEVNKKPAHKDIKPDSNVKGSDSNMEEKDNQRVLKENRARELERVRAMTNDELAAEYLGFNRNKYEKADKDFKEARSSFVKKWGAGLEGVISHISSMKDIERLLKDSTALLEKQRLVFDTSPFTSKTLAALRTRITNAAKKGKDIKNLRVVMSVEPERGFWKDEDFLAKTSMDLASNLIKDSKYTNGAKMGNTLFWTESDLKYGFKLELSAEEHNKLADIIAGAQGDPENYNKRGEFKIGGTPQNVPEGLGSGKKNNGEKEGKFSRVNLSDIPNAHKVNLKKYLSAKRKAAVDEAWSKANFDNSSARMLQDSYNKMRDAFNDNFDSMSKAERAEQLYRILKVKNAMEKKS